MSAQDGLRSRARIGRRALLRGAGGVAIALPFLAAMQEKPAGAAPPPKRFLVFFTGLGTVKKHWAPTGSEKSFTLGEVLAPLAPFQDKLLVLEGIDMESAYHGPGDPHQQGIAQALTGTELLEGDLFPYACNASKTVGWGGGISVDQFLGQKLGQTTKFPTLEFGVQVEVSNVSSRLSYAAPGVPVPPEDDPRAMFDRMFKDATSSAKNAAKLASKRHRVLDAVMADTKDLTGRLGAEDRQKLERHLDAIHSIDKQLDAHVTIGGACQKVDIGEPLDIYANDNYPAIGKLQIDLLAMALACDLTRIASIQWTTTQTGKVFTWLGQTLPHHTLSHSGDANAEAQKSLVQIGNWHSQQLAYLMQKLSEIPEGDGSVLDHTLILWCTDISQGNTHARRDMPYVLAGGAGGALSMGRHLKYNGAHHNDLLVSICQAMGVDVASFGNPAHCNGPLGGLTG